MQDKERILISNVKKTTRQIEPRTLFFPQIIQSIVESIGTTVCKIVDSLTSHGFFLRFEVKNSSDGWAVDFSLELR
jgi:hypothetical protein